MSRPNTKDQRTLDRIVERLAATGFALPGTILERSICCKKPTCRCTADPPRLHGPYYQWTRKVNGKTLTRLLTTEQIDRYQPWFDNARQLRADVSELEALTLQIAESTEGWD